MKNNHNIGKGHLFKLKVGYLLLALSIFISCKDDHHCQDIDYGRQYMSDSSKSSFAYKGGETLIFKDSMNQEVAFQIIPPFIKIYPTWLSLSQDVTEGPCIGEMKIRSELQSLIVNFNSDTLDYYIIYEQRVHSRILGTTPIYYDIMVLEMVHDAESPATWYISTNHLLDPKGNEDYFADIPISYEFAEFITLNGKSFNQVYFNKLSDGSALYFNHSLGLIGFKEGNKSLWVLDRIE